MFQSAMFMELLEQFCKAAHQNSKDKGFWGTQGTVKNVSGDIVPAPLPAPNYGEKYLLMVSEILEMFEAYRKGKLTAPCNKTAYITDPAVTHTMRLRCKVCNGKGNIPEPVEVPPGFLGRVMDCQACAGVGLVSVTGMRPLTNEEEELADICIRIADYCGYRNIDLGAAILSKMNYNATRPHMHGKTC